MDVLSVDQIRKSFRKDLSPSKREVLHGVSFQAHEGEILGFLGPNGAGKTTTIKILLGLIRPDSGTVTLFDRRVGDRAAMARIGYMPENPYFHPHLSLDEFLVFCGRLSGVDDGRLGARVAETKELVGLEQEGETRLKHFSKGMLQRAGLAQAVLHDPDLLVLDEPFSGLDPLGRIMVRDTLQSIKSRGKTIFFSSHILPDMEALCDRTCIIREGVIVTCVGHDGLFRLGEGMVEVTVRDLAAEDIEAVNDYIESATTGDREVTLLVREQRFVRTVVQHVYNRGGEILKVVNQHPTLEQVFLDEISREPAAPERRGDREQTPVGSREV